ncbi:hypothetical protein [Caviibacter abscessus]|uniref:hypothetical protein n=1 Tax=Caviibacter abscessus TaxID=1766719 RepID=UPI0008331367|nr:hypothetical protein [Caviibacter abscessus]
MEKYEKLDNVALLLGVNKEKYFSAKTDFFNDRKSAIVKYFGYEDEEIQGFTDFWYYYLADNTNCFFHNFKSNGYTKNIQNFLEKNNIETLNIDYESFINKENTYRETLFDILLSEIKYNFKNIKLEIFGINVGFESNIYYILPNSILKEIKNQNSDLFMVFDFKKLEEIYGEIYVVTKEIENIEFVQAGDYIELDKNSGIYQTLFNPLVKKNYNLHNVPNECIELVL